MIIIIIKVVVIAVVVVAIIVAIEVASNSIALGPGDRGFYQLIRGFRSICWSEFVEFHQDRNVVGWIHCKKNW